MLRSFTVFFLSFLALSVSFELFGQSLRYSDFILNDTVISDTTSSLQDPEIDQFGRHFCWAGPEGIWVGDIDSVTGNFVPDDGKGLLIDSSPSFLGMYLVANGPEWAISQNGSLLIYPDSVSQNIIQVGTAIYDGSDWQVNPLPQSHGRIPYFGSYDENYTWDGITCASYDTMTMENTGMRLRNSTNTYEVTPPDLTGGRWIKGFYGITLANENSPPYLAGIFNPYDQSFIPVANFDQPIDQVWATPLPEYNDVFVVWCIEKKTEKDQITIFVQEGNQWNKIDSIIMPTDRKIINSPEPFWWKGRTYLSLLTKARPSQPDSLYDEVWIVSMDPNNRIYRKVSNDLPLNRTDPEVFITTEEPVIYYTEIKGDGIRVIHKCASGLSGDIHTYEKSPFREMVFYKDYFPGTYDINGRYLGSTETMSIIQHKGKLFAGMGNWMDYPWIIGDENEGSQILRKDSYDSPWVVDTSFGWHSMRTDAILSVTFTKDYLGDTLAEPENILVCGAPYYKDNFEEETIIWTRNDDIGTWIKNIAYTGQNLHGIRSFAMHTDKITGQQWLFCGIVEGNIIKAAFDPSAEGRLTIDTTKEIQQLGRVMAMCECNGDLYAAAGVDIVGGDTVGGLFRRIDGEEPSWELIYRWPYTELEQGDEKNIMRGITCVLDPKGSGNQVIIGTRANPGIVQVFEPANDHEYYTEFYIRDFFASQWDLSYYQGPTLSAYNYFVPDTLDGELVWWQSLWAEYPENQTHPYNGSHFLVRYENGTFEYGDIFDDNYPLPDGENLRACRNICKSPFPEEPYAYYFGGYDAAHDTSNNTSWIYKGVITEFTGVSSDLSPVEQIKIYPNPAKSSIYLSVQNPEKVFYYHIFSLTGQIVLSGVLSKDFISIKELTAGLYFIRIYDDHGFVDVLKFVRQ